MDLRKLGYLSLSILLMVLASGTAMAIDNPNVSLDIATDYAGKYIWRGQNVNDESVLQPYLGFSAYGFSGSIWANMDLTNGSQTIPDRAARRIRRSRFVPARCTCRQCRSKYPMIHSNYLLPLPFPIPKPSTECLNSNSLLFSGPLRFFLSTGPSRFKSFHTWRPFFPCSRY